MEYRKDVYMIKRRMRRTLVGRSVTGRFDSSAYVEVNARALPNENPVRFLLQLKNKFQVRGLLER